MNENYDDSGRETEEVDIRNVLPQTQCLSEVIQKYNEVGAPKRVTIIQPKNRRANLGTTQYPRLNGVNLVTGRCPAKDALAETFQRTPTIWKQAKVYALHSNTANISVNKHLYCKISYKVPTYCDTKDIFN